ncbi:MAG: tryptophan-rich sensory protein [Cyclobacteriaceae bacterium]|nr:tryptophan-rich sensory protein [Cyclobacteriaceae bacterium]MCH8517915.1 tryptophan-rich sensory protein [Cyclobacteriaceae bacterium]
MTRAKTLLISNSLALLVMLIVNYLAGTGKLNGVTQGELSEKYNALITPAGYAFSIWGIIYLMLIAFNFHQWYEHIQLKRNENIYAVGSLFTLSCLWNCLWLIAWVSSLVGLSTIIMLFLLSTLVAIVLRTRMELDHVPFRVIAFLWWPFALYLGWISLATVVNVSILFKEWGLGGYIMGEATWTILMLGVAGFLYFFLLQSRNLRESALVGIWGISAVAVKQMNNEPILARFALLVCFVLAILVLIHAYQNRDTLPFIGKNRPT